MRNFTKFLLMAYMFSFGYSEFIHAQNNAQDYTLTRAIETYTPLTSSTSVISGTTDNSISKVAIPGGFFFMGRLHDTVLISSNGHLSFPSLANTNSVATSTYHVLKDNLVNTGGAISGYGADLHGLNTNAKIHYALVGNEFVVEWYNSRRYLVTDDVLNFQIRLNQSTNQVKIIYGDCTPGVSSNYQGQVGIRGINRDIIALGINATDGPWINAIESSSDSALLMYYNGDNPNTKPELGTTFIFTPKNCLSISTPTFSDILSNSAIITWNSSPSTLGYEYYVSTDPSLPTTATPIATTGTSVNLTGLQSNTIYYVWVRQQCSASDISGWSNRASFTTLCGIKDVPYMLNFETATTPTLPSCINSISVTGAVWNTTTSGGSKVGRHVSNSTVASNSWLFTEAINLTAGTIYKLTYRYNNSSSTTTQKMRVAYGMGNTIADMTDILAEHLTIQGITFRSNVVYFRPTTTGVYYFGFHANSAANQGSLYLDDVNITLAESCLSLISATLSNPTVDGFTLTLDASTVQLPANGYEYFVSTVNQAPTANISGIAFTTTTTTITGLNSGTSYYVWARTVCGNNEASEWVFAGNIATTCSVQTAPTSVENFDSYLTNAGQINSLVCWLEAKSVAATPFDPNTTQNAKWTSDALGNQTNGSKSASINLYGTNIDWLISPAIDLGSIPNTYRLEYKHILTNYATTTYANSYGTHKVDVLISLDGGQTWDASNIIYTHQNSFIASDSMVKITLPYTGIVKFAFRATTSTTSLDLDFFIDDFLVAPLPTCIEPATINTIAITHNSATVEVTSINNNTDYEYYYSTTSTVPSNTPTGTIIDGATATLSGLQSNTTYYVWARSICSTNDISEWSRPITFRTLCAPQNIPYLEDFESVTTPTIPSCITTAATVGNLWTTANFGGSKVARQVSTTIAANSWMFTNGIYLTAGESYRLSYKYANSSTTLVQKLNIAYGTASSEAGMTQSLFVHPDLSSTTFRSNFIDFVAPTTDIYYIGFQTDAIASQGTVYVDDILVDLTPSCLEPTTVTASNIMPTSATLTWTNPNPNTVDSYEYYYDITTTAPSATTTVSGTVTTTTVALNTLTPNTTYYLWVRSVCDANNTSPWTDVFSFSTPCASELAPTVLQDFNSYTGNANAGSSLPCWSEGTSTELAPFTLILTNARWTNDVIPGATNSARINLYGTNTDWLVSNLIDLGTIPNIYRLKYRYLLSMYSGTAVPTDFGTHKVDIIVSTDGGQTWDAANIIHTHQGAYNQADSIVQIDLPYTGLIKIAFRATTSSNTPDLNFFIDNFIVEEIPSCEAPNNLTVNNQISNNANISWAAPALGDMPIGYQYYYSTSNAVPTSSSATISTTLTNASLTGLLLDTTYYVRVRSICSATDTSAWSGAMSFRTGYCVPTGSTTYRFESFITTGAEENLNFTNSLSQVYLNQTALVLKAYPNQVINVASRGNATQLHYLWIDYNNDMDFDDAGETIYTTTTSINTYNGSFTIPSSVQPGIYRMRAAIATSGGTIVPTPCASSWARYVDFTLEVLNPCPAVTISMDYSNVCGTTLGTATVNVQTTANNVSYLWVNGETTATITGLNIGNYMVSVTTDAGCTVVDSVQIQSSTISAAATIVSQDCGNASGAINLTAVGTNLSYLWSNGATTANISGLAAGTYTVTISDNICERVISTAIIYEDAFVVTGDIVNDISTNPGSGSITITGPTNATYLWSNGATTSAISGLTAGTYTVVITDADGCFIERSFVVDTEISVAQVALSQIKLYPNPTTHSVHVAGLPMDSKVTVVNNLGQVIRSFISQNDIEEIDLSNLAPSTYWIRIENQLQAIVLPVVRIK